MTANEIVSKVKNLVPVSHAALNLIGLLDQPAVSNEDIVRVLKFDNVLTAKLLRSCNSSLYGFEEPVASVEQAVLILGHQQILQVVLSIAFSSSMATPLPGYAAAADELWNHSLFTALASETLCKDGLPVTAEPPVAFTAGLLHDFGKLALNQVLTDEFQSAIRQRICHDKISRTDAEHEVLGTDHCEVGACLLQSWRLPEQIVEAVANHHRPLLRPQPKLSAIVHTANCLGHLIGSGAGWEILAITADPDTIAALGITREKVEDLMISVHDALAQVRNIASAV